MKQARVAILMLVLSIAVSLFAGCPKTSIGKLAGQWQYVAVNAGSTAEADFRAFLTLDEPGSGGLGAFRYEEQRWLPDDNEDAMSWHVSYYADGYYRTAPYGYVNESDIFTYWADTELNAIISEYAPVLTQSFDNATGMYTYTLEPVAVDGSTPMNSRAVLTVNPFDELVIAWGNRPVAETGTIVREKEFTINEGIVADTYVRVVN